MALAWAQSAVAAPPALATPSAAASVEEITITAQRPTQQTLLDRKVYSVTTDLQATTGVAADILNKIPSLSVDADGAVSLRGDSNVTILIDGKPSAQFNGPAQGLSLLQFPASDIDRVEVLTHPPAQYKAEGSGGVINIVTRKTRRPGLTGAARASLGDKRRFVTGLDLAYNNGPLRLSGGASLRQEAKQRVVGSDRTTTDPTLGPVRARQTSDERFRRLIPSVQGDLTYDMNPRSTLGASFSHRELSGNRYFDQHDAKALPAGPPLGVSDRHSDGHEWSVSDSKGLTFEQKLWRPQETLSLSLQRSATRERERYAYRNTFALPVADPTFDDLRLSLDLVKTEASIDYDLPLSGDRDLKLGYAFEADRNAFDNVGDTLDPATRAPTPDPAVTNHFRYRQEVSAAYADYRTSLGSLRLDAGLRLEAARVATRQITGDVAGGWHDVAAYPTLHVERALNADDKLTAAIARRVTRPDPEALNPFADHQDTHNLRAGNPNLRPQQTWSLEAGYSHAGARNYGATAYYRIDRNSVTDIVQPISDDVVLTTKANLPRRRSAGLEFNVAGRLIRELTYGLSGNAFYAEIDGRSLGAPAPGSKNGLKSNTGVNLKLNLDYRPTRRDAAQISIIRTARRLTPQGSLDAANLVNLGYKHDFRPDLSAVATVSDLFDSQKIVRRNASPDFAETYTRHQFGRVAYVGLVYSFGGRKKDRPAFEYEP
jgi:outer membrane receptor protein involved in Fe transport